jgi:hypothetical protein
MRRAAATSPAAVNGDASGRSRPPTAWPSLAQAALSGQPGCPGRTRARVIEGAAPASLPAAAVGVSAAPEAPGAPPVVHPLKPTTAPDKVPGMQARAAVFSKSRLFTAGVLLELVGP